MAINKIVKNVGTFVKNLPSDTKWYIVGIGLGSLISFSCCSEYIKEIRNSHKVHRKIEYYDAMTKVNDMLLDSGAPYSLTVEFEENNDAVIKLKKYMEADK